MKKRDTFTLLVVVIIVFFVVLAFIQAGNDTKHMKRDEPQPYVPSVTWTPQPYMATNYALTRSVDATQAARLAPYNATPTIGG